MHEARHAAVQKTLDELTAGTDGRLEIFDLKIERLHGKTLSLSGRLLADRQLADLKEVLRKRFPDLSLATGSIRVLRQSKPTCLHVATNLTGLYEKPSFAGPLASELYFGTPLELLGEEGRWALTCQSDGYLGWAYRPYLADGLIAPATHVVLAPATELRASPEPHAPVRTRLVSGTGVRIVNQEAGWACVQANETGWLPAGFLRSTDDFPKAQPARTAIIRADAARMIGTPYVWGGTSGNGIDCSGLARLLHRWIGIDIPRDADLQHAAAHLVEAPFEAGDLFFFAEGDGDRKITHVGVSLGGWQMVHSSRKRNGVYVEDLQASESLKEIYAGAGSFLR